MRYHTRFKCPGCGSEYPDQRYCGCGIERVATVDGKHYPKGGNCPAVHGPTYLERTSNTCRCGKCRARRRWQRQYYRDYFDAMRFGTYVDRLTAYPHQRELFDALVGAS